MASFHVEERNLGCSMASLAYLPVACERLSLAVTICSFWLSASRTVFPDASTILESPADHLPPPCWPTELAKT